MPRAWVLHRRLNKAAIDRVVQQKKKKEFALCRERSVEQTLSSCIEIIISRLLQV